MKAEVISSSLPDPVDDQPHKEMTLRDLGSSATIKQGLKVNVILMQWMPAFLKGFLVSNVAPRSHLNQNTSLTFSDYLHLGVCHSLARQNNPTLYHSDTY